VINEIVSIKGARIEYGVVIDPQTHEIDFGETEKIRTQKRKMKKDEQMNDER
jgi:hypothetical protein